MSEETDRPGLEIVYDGDCPFCSSYVGMLRLRATVGPVELIDARSGDPRVAAFAAQGFSADTGMIVRHRDDVLHGAEAMRLLTLLSETRGPLSWLLRQMFRHPRAALPCYRVLAAGRRLTLRLMGRRPIGL